MIADNVGDNVGDCAGMAADLFETYVVTAVAAMILGGLVFKNFSAAVTYPLILGGVSVLASLVGTMVIKLGQIKNYGRALSRFDCIRSACCYCFYFVTKSVMADNGLYSATNIYLSALIGLVVTGLLVVITEYYTSTSYKPVKSIAEASTTGHGTNIIRGLAVGMRSTVWPVLVIAGAIGGAYYLAELYGVAIAAMSMLSMTG